MNKTNEKTVRGPEVPESEDAQKIQATRLAEAEVLAVKRHQKINLIWEYTQASIAVGISLAMVYCSVNKIDAPEVRNAFFLIIGFYFGRTNHTRPTGESK